MYTYIYIRGYPAARVELSIDLSSPSMCLSNDNKLPNEYVQSYSIIATTGVAAAAAAVAVGR